MLFYTRDVCNESQLNQTLAEHDHVYMETERVTCLAILPIAAVALAANSLSMFIFARQKFDNRAVRFSLLSISCTEVCLQCALLVETGIVRSGFEHWHTPFSFTLTSCVHLSINALMSIRNWNVLLISAARCEVVVRPLASRRFLLFSRARLTAAFCLVVAVALGLAVAATFTHIGVLCSNLSPGTVVMRPVEAGAFLAGVPWAVYVFQSLVPTVLIPLPTAIMWTKIRRRRIEKRQHQHQHQHQHQQLHQHDQLHQHEHQHRLTSQLASQMVLGLAILFCVFEFPTFVSTTCLNLNPTLLDSLPFHPDVVTNVLSVTDSLLNFFVYSASSAKFRADLRRLLCRCGCRLPGPPPPPQSDFALRSRRPLQQLPRQPLSLADD